MKLRSGLLAGDRFFEQLGPETFSLVVVNQDIALVEPPGNAECEFLAIDHAGVDHPRLGQRSECHHNGYTGDSIVDHFVPVQNPDRISPGLIADLYTDDLIFGFH